MSILSGDVKLVASQVMDDVPEGGGQPTATVIADGVSNAVFNDISELDRAGGRVNLRKLHVHVQTDNTDGYFGGNIIVAEAPQDPRVSITMFSTKDTFDRREQAQSRIEAYLGAGPEWAGYLLENHIAGQRTVQLFQQVTSDAPPVGHTLLLVYNEGQDGEKSQYVRTTRVSSQTRTFFAAATGKAYQALVVTCEISDPLRYDFRGSAPNEFFQRDRTATMTRDTVVADAASYAGVSKLVDGVGIGDLSARVQSVFTQLVPSAQTEIPLADMSAAGQKTTLVESASGTVSYTVVQPFNSSTVLSLGNSVRVGSLAITGGATLHDEGGQVFDGTTAVGTIDYARGEVRFVTSAPTYNGEKTVTFRPAGAPLELADTASIAVTQETRAFNYIITIDPPPAPGSTQVSYRAGGKWYDLKDNGAGVLKGSDSSFGSGTVSFTTGTIAITTGALPDVGGQILYAWGSPANFVNRSALVVSSPTIKAQLAHTGVAPGTFHINWNDGAAHTASDDGFGNITGAATGTIRYQTGEVEFAPAALPAGGQQYNFTYSWGASTAVDFPNEQEVAGVVTLDLDAANVLPSTVEIEVPVFYERARRVIGADGNTSTIEPTFALGFATLRLKDDGAGGITYHGIHIGDINYATGVLTFNVGLTEVSYNRDVFSTVVETVWVGLVSAS